MSRKNRIRKPFRKPNKIAALRAFLTVLAELCGIAGFLLALYIFLKGV
jgi:hypothetical protein